MENFKDWPWWGKLGTALTMLGWLGGGVLALSHHLSLGAYFLFSLLTGLAAVLSAGLLTLIYYTLKHCLTEWSNIQKSALVSAVLIWGLLAIISAKFSLQALGFLGAVFIIWIFYQLRLFQTLRKSDTGQRTSAQPQLGKKRIRINKFNASRIAYLNSLSVVGEHSDPPVISGRVDRQHP